MRKSFDSKTSPYSSYLSDKKKTVSTPERSSTVLPQSPSLMCTTCNNVFLTQYLLDLHAKTCKKPITPKKQIAHRDTKFTSHFRVNTLGESTMVHNVIMIASETDQFMMGGKSACTTIAIEAAANMLLEQVQVSEVYQWDSHAINDILKSGCMQDPQTGHLAFDEAFQRSARLQSMLVVCDTFQESIHVTFINY